MDIIDLRFYNITVYGRKRLQLIGCKGIILCYGNFGNIADGSDAFQIAGDGHFIGIQNIRNGLIHDIKNNAVQFRKGKICGKIFGNDGIQLNA